MGREKNVGDLREILRDDLTGSEHSGADVASSRKTIAWSLRNVQERRGGGQCGYYRNHLFRVAALLYYTLPAQ